MLDPIPEASDEEDAILSKTLIATEPPSLLEAESDEGKPSTPVEVKVPGSPPPEPPPLSPALRPPTSPPPPSPLSPDSPRSPFPRPSVVPAVLPVPPSPASSAGSPVSASSDVAETGHDSHELHAPRSPSPRRRKHSRRDSGYTAEMLVPQPFHPGESKGEVESQMDATARLARLIDAVEEWKRTAVKVQKDMEGGDLSEVERFRMEALWRDVEARRDL